MSISCLDINNNDNHYRRVQNTSLYIHDNDTGFGRFVPVPLVTCVEKPIKIVYEGDLEIGRDVNCNDYYKFTARKGLTNLQKQQLIDLINEVRV